MTNQIQKIVLFLLLLFFANACFNGAQKQLPPVQLGIIYDCTRSAPQNQVPVLTASHLDSLIAIVQHHGGTLSFLPIAKASFIPLARLDLQTPVGKTLREKALLVKQQRVKIAAWRTCVLSVLGDGRKAKKTDFWGAVHRYSRMFQEPVSGALPSRFLVIISDGLDDMKRWQPMKLPEDILVPVVGLSDKSNAAAINEHVQRFESIESALRYIGHLTQNPKTKGDLS